MGDVEKLRDRIKELERALTSANTARDDARLEMSLYRSLVEASPDAIILCDIDRNLIVANRMAAYIFGYTNLEEMIGRNIIDFIDEKDRGKIEEDFKKALQHKLMKNQEYVFRKKDGNLFFGVLNVSTILDLNGKPLSFIGVLRDITERKKMEIALRESQQRYKNFIEQSSEGIWRFELEKPLSPKMSEDEQIEHAYKYAYLAECNKAMAEMYGFSSPKEMVGIRLKDLLIKEDPRNIEYLRSFIRSGYHLSNAESHEKDKDGKIRFFLNNLIAIFDRDFIVGAWGTQRDITVVRRIERVLKESEEHFRKLTESSLAGVYIVQDNKFRYVNPALARIFGYKPEELIDKLGSLDLTHPQDRAIVEENIRLRLEGKAESTHYTFRGIRKDGSVIYCEVLGSIIDYEGRPANIGTVLDVTERKYNEELLRESESKFKALSEEAAVGVYLIHNGVLEYVNPKLAEMFDYSVGKLLGRKIFSVIYHDDVESFRRHIKDLFSGRTQSVKYKCRGVKRNGEIIYLNIYGTYIVHEGKPAVIGTIIDDTEEIINKKKIEKMNRELKLFNRRLKQLALRDVQTGLYNHRYLGECIEAEFYRAKRYGQFLSIIMVDIDYFKSINDVYGHKFGDLVIKQFASQLKKNVRKYDILIRFGGEEFVVMSPGINRDAALVLAYRIMNSISLYNFGNRKHSVKVRLSIGVVSYPEDKVLKGADLIDLVDRVVEKVKEDGGNRVYSSLDLKRKRKATKRIKEESEEIRSLKKKIVQLTKKANQSLIESVFAFAKTIELKDHITGEHVERTVYYATAIAKKVGLPKDEIERIREAAILHDLGKIGISENILLKKAKLTKKEFNELKRHPQIGVDIIRPIQFFHSIIPLVLYHHERWDGKGYPSGLKGEEIPIGARIIAVADAYQALRANRPYRKAFSKKKAMQILNKEAGNKFDPHIVEVFMEVLQKEDK